MNILCPEEGKHLIESMFSCPTALSKLCHKKLQVLKQNIGRVKGLTWEVIGWRISEKKKSETDAQSVFYLP